MAKKAMVAGPDLMASAQAAGLDLQKFWDWAGNLNWFELFNVVRQLINLLKGKSPAVFGAAAGGGSSQEQLEHAKAHFEAITELSECGAKCCGHP